MHGQPFSNSARDRGRLRALGLRPRKSLSQSFLQDPRVARAIIRAARLDSARDEVLEVGPGLGVLTRGLVAAARRVVAVEVDPALAEALRAALPTPSLHVETADILRVDPASFFDAPYIVVANLPYHITSPALRCLLESGPPFASRLVITVQQEVAERMTAPVGELSALAVIIQAQARANLVRHVPADAFYPRPRVDSAVLRLEPLADAERPVARAAFAAFVDFLHAGFKQPRKQIANSLSDGLAVDKSVVVHLLEGCGIAPERRPQTVSVQDWARLFAAASP